MSPDPMDWVAMKATLALRSGRVHNRERHFTPSGGGMRVSRRDFLRVSSSTAIRGLVALGVDLTPTRARAAALRIKDAKAFPSVCPYCAVGCGTVVHTVEGQIVNIEGDVRSPINQGNLCPKGAAIYQLH